MADRKELERYFNEIDTDKSGFIDEKELGALLAKCGYELSKEEVKVFCSICTVYHSIFSI